MGSHLGFYDLMNIAEQNIEETERKAKGQNFVSYTPSGAKKLNPKQKKLSENVQKFLAKREEEKKLQLEEAKRKRERLLELRSHDKKATKRVGQMLRMTKSANKSVISDAMNCLNDSLAEQGEEQQPDEDDYGYVSQYAEEFHKKMLEKYKAIPASKPVKARPNVPVPTVQSLKTSKGSNSNSGKDGKDGTTSVVQETTCAVKKPKEVKKSAPPPLNFNDLMDLAKQKCLEPVTIKSNKPEKAVEEKYEFGRPMTAKEKAEYLQERAIRARISVPNFDTKSVPSNDRNNNKQSKSSTGKAAPSFKIPSKKPKSHDAPLPPTAPPPPVSTPTQLSNSSMGSPLHAPSVTPRSSVPLNRPTSMPPNVPKPTQMSSVNPSKSRSSITSNSQGPSNPRASKSISNSSTMPPPRSVQIKEERKSPPPPGKPLNSSLPTLSASKSAPPIPSSREMPKERGVKRKADQIDMDRHQREAPRLIAAPKIKQEFDDGSYSMKRSQDRGRGEPGFRSLPPDIKIKSEPKENRPNPRRDVPTAPKPKPTGRQIIDSDEDEEDYDSEMDDFIDDSDLNGGNISDIIRQITGYDKRRYEDGSDDECMESSAYEQMREESRSLRIGIQEDLEDMRLEAEEKKRKAQMMKKRK